MFKIDKSVFTAEERAQYEALIAKAMVDPEAAEEEMEEEVPAFPPQKKKPPVEKEADVEDYEEDYEEGEEGMEKSKCKKSVSPEIQKALKRLDTLEKSIEMGKFSEIAKKYAPLGEDEAELAKTLYTMKKSDENSYNAYISILDKSLGIVEKSGIFTEIGKSAGGYSAAGGATSKADAKAQEIMKADPHMSYTDAIAKAWEDPALMAEYDSEYMA